MVRYTVEPPTPTLAAISSSPTPASAASRICARLSLRAACRPGRELLRALGTRTGAEYEFRHAISEEVTYNLLPFAQRRVLHAAIATALEQDHAGHLEPLYGQLARHWERAGEMARAIEYLERAAEQALRSYANHDAIQYVRRAFELSDHTADGNGDERLSRWETVLGDAYNELADYTRSSPHYERGLSLAGQRVAHTSFERTTGLIAHIAEQAWLRLVSPRLFARKRPDRETSRRVAHIRERLAERHFFRNESTAVLDETLAAVNFAERGGAVAEMISGYSALAIGMGMSGLTRPARFYRDRAMSLARQFEPTPEAARAYLLAAVLEYGLGGWDVSEQFARRSLSLYRQLGDRGRAQTVLNIMYSCRILRGELEAADRLQREATEDIEAETLQGKAWRLAARSMLTTIRGRAEAEDLEELSEVGDAQLATRRRTPMLWHRGGGLPAARGDREGAVGGGSRPRHSARDRDRVGKLHLRRLGRRRSLSRLLVSGLARGLSGQGLARLQERRPSDAELAGLPPALAPPQRTRRVPIRKAGASPQDVDAGPRLGGEIRSAPGAGPRAARDRPRGGS